MKKSAINRQRGSIILPVAVSILVGLILLGGVQLGYYFYMKRELQNTADMAVLSGVQMISDSCQQAKNATKANIIQNFNHDTLADDMIEMECGTWRTDLPAPRHFVNTANAEGHYNALRVSIIYNALPFMPFSSKSTIAVEAIAKSNIPVAAFQVGSQLLRFDNSALLGSLLGIVGLDVNNLTLLDSEGLANTKITPAGLLDLLGVDLGIGGLGALTPNGVADINNLTLLNLVDASVNAVTDSTLGVQLEALRAKLLDLNLGGVKIPIGNADNQSGLFAFLGIGNAGGDEPLGSALDVQLGLGDILKTAIALGANGHALEVPSLSVLGAVKAKLSIVEPPVIAIGPVGTTGHSAQIRLWLDIDTDNLLGGLLKPLVSGLLGTRVHLPVAIDVVSGTGTLEKLECSRKPQTMDISVRSRVLNVCVGGMDAASIMSDKRACEVGLQETELIRLLHLPVLSGKLHIEPLEYTELVENLEVGQTVSTRPNPLQLGNTVDNLVTGLLNLLSGLLRPPVSMDGWEGNYKTNPNLIPGLLESYLEKSKENNAGMYNVDVVTQLVLNGSGNPGEDGYMPPLLVEDFTFDRAIPTSCVLVTCIPNDLVNPWKRGKFSEAFKAYTSVPLGLLELVGIPWIGNNFQNCAGLLSSLLGWNTCVKHNLTELFKQHQNQIAAVNPDSAEIQSLLNKNSNEVTCNGALCVLLKPVLNLLKPILNGVGLLLTALLDDVLGLELGRTDVTALAIDCDPAQLVY
ncbi:MAG: pilus assembly protein TadG-related protein [Advenella sp.]|nr:pilus assembly protein TadG-related protein [Advenella sp.]